jgi:ribosomal protein S18 acetylase RimI-like enzyme
MDNLQIIHIENIESPYIKQVIDLFGEMYDFMAGKGLMLPLAENGAELWINSQKNTLGKFALLCISLEEDEVTGFGHAAVKFGPDYLGSPKIGVLTHIYVKESKRRSGTGAALLECLENWFAEKKVHSIELQVVSENDSAIKFWKKNNYQQELLQFRKLNKE